MSLPRKSYCHTCGADLTGDLKVGDIRINGTLCIEDYRKLESREGVSIVMHPQVIVAANVWRNGGESEDCRICRECQKIGFRFIRDEINRIMTNLNDTQPLRKITP